MNDFNQLLDEMMPDIKLLARRFYIIAAIFVALSVFVGLGLFFLTGSLVVLVAMLAGAASYGIAGLMVQAWGEDE